VRRTGDLFLVVDGLESVVPMLQHLGVHGGEGRNPGSIAKQVESIRLLHVKTTEYIQKGNGRFLAYIPS
jgi:hypothetical protein